jgi:hypothetical protein
MRVGFRAIGEVSRITRQTPRRNVMSPSNRLKNLFMLAVNPCSRPRHSDESLRLRIDRSAMSSSAILILKSYATSFRRRDRVPAGACHQAFAASRMAETAGSPVDTTSTARNDVPAGSQLN